MYVARTRWRSGQVQGCPKRSRLGCKNVWSDVPIPHLPRLASMSVFVRADPCLSLPLSLPQCDVFNPMPHPHDLDNWVTHRGPQRIGERKEEGALCTDSGGGGILLLPKARSAPSQRPKSEQRGVVKYSFYGWLTPMTSWRSVSQSNL